MRLGDFENYTKQTGRKWELIDLKLCFSNWLAHHKYREEYFSQPEDISDQVESEFKDFVVDYLKKVLSKQDIDENTLVAITNVTSLFGFLKLSDILNNIYSEIKGRLLIFFSGEFDQNHYRLLNARDGWSYLARPITI